MRRLAAFRSFAAVEEQSRKFMIDSLSVLLIAIQDFNRVRRFTSL